MRVYITVNSMSELRTARTDVIAQGVTVDNIGHDSIGYFMDGTFTTEQVTLIKEQSTVVVETSRPAEESFTPTIGTNIITLTNEPSVPSISFYIDRALQILGIDWDIAGNIITMKNGFTFDGMNIVYVKYLY